MRRLHVAVAQIHARTGDVAGNLARLERQVRCAAIAGVEVILFAEAVAQGYDLSPENLALAEPLDGALGRRLSELAAAHRLAILAGFLEREEGLVYNSQLVAWPDGRRARERKHNLSEAERAAGLAAGPRERALFDFNGVRCAILICADTGIPGLRPELARRGVEFLFIPTGGGGKRAEMLHESDLDTPAGRAAYVRDRAIVHKPEALVEPEAGSVAGFASANALGHDGREAYHRGHCMIVDRHGVLRAQIAGTNVLEHQQDQMVHAELSFS